MWETLIKDVTKAEVKEFFEEYGPVSLVKIEFDPKTRESLGHGLVEFTNG